MNRQKELKSSLYEDIRIKRTPKNNPLRGYWTGERGNSTYIPTTNQDEIIKILNEHHLCGIKYEKGIIDLNPCSIATVSLVKMYIIRYKNFKICDMLCADLWNNTNFLNKHDWTSKEIKYYRKQYHYSWHECNDCIHCELVPTKINSFFSHFGGIAECKLTSQNYDIVYN